ncbi:hypothetical protein JIR23_21125 [Bradyrhizobium diazoefficiens]|nr:hypothetical protein [Bradyrhizobium diazoefficiens]QQN62104.1 hypothetical protein JIR23_21125 [Bradyrhizobium diazoefficiens]
MGPDPALLSLAGTAVVGCHLQQAGSLQRQGAFLRQIPADTLEARELVDVVLMLPHPLIRLPQTAGVNVLSPVSRVRASVASGGRPRNR